MDCLPRVKTKRSKKQIFGASIFVMTIETKKKSSDLSHDCTVSLPTIELIQQQLHKINHTLERGKSYINSYMGLKYIYFWINSPRGPRSCVLGISVSKVRYKRLMHSNSAQIPLSIDMASIVISVVYIRIFFND